MQVPLFSTPIWKHQLLFFNFSHFFVVLLGILNGCFLQTGSFLLILKECIHVHNILTFAMLLSTSSAPFFIVLFLFHSQWCCDWYYVSSCGNNFNCHIVAGPAVVMTVFLAFSVIIILVVWMDKIVIINQRIFLIVSSQRFHNNFIKLF